MSDAREGPFHLYEVLKREYEELYGDPPGVQLPPDWTDADERLPEEERRRVADERLTEVVNLIHARAAAGRPRTALCFSGGGIRSATFGLGVLQGLARHGLLTEFDYLSTVSGGGYLGGWLSAWLKRESERAAGGGPRTPEHERQAVLSVQRALNSTPPSKLQPEAEPVRHLRSYSNYMSPRLGLLSADTWTLVAIYLRNLFLIWLVLVPLIIGLLAVPRFSLAIAGWRGPGPVGGLFGIEGFWLGASFALAVLCGVGSIAYIIASRPSVADYGHSRLPAGRRSEGWFLVLGMLPLLLASRAAATHWAWLRVPAGDVDYAAFGFPLLRVFGHNAFVFAAFGALLYLGGYLAARLFLLKKALRLEWLVALIAGGLGGLLTYLVAAYAFDNPVGAAHADAAGVARAALYVCLGAPTFLLLFLAAATIFVGLSSFRTTDADREWLARAGAWVLITAAGWAALSSVVIFGPVLLFYFGAKVLTAAGGAAGLVTLVGAASGRTAANSKEEAKEGASGRAPFLKRLALALAAPVFALFLLVVLSLATTYLARGLFDALAGAGWVPRGAAAALSLRPVDWDALPRLDYDPRGLLNVLYHLPGWFLFALVLAVVGFGVLMGFFVNINKFSLHGAYRDRLIRAYLGASRPRRERAPNPLTGFDEGDNVEMRELVGRPLHVVNMTLNLVSPSGEQLAWQDRKAESFTVSRHHAGSFCVGYRDSRVYGGNRKLGRAISLGTSVAVSGAAASPNMGYYSSAFVTFLLSVFNVRLGWWLGNPGRAGRATYDRPGPSFGPRALVAETLGRTNDRHPYVYLSDGGHFENLGLYEMVLRRCHFIVVSDAAADPSLTFNDLGNAISKVRQDLGIPIVFDNIPITRRDRGQVNYDPPEAADAKYCAVGTVCYKQKDGEAARNGVIIYIKPNVYGGEPADVFHYAKSNPAFPHESTGDQMYSESQFESYRMLGYHVADAISRRGPVTDLDSFRDAVRKYLAPPGSPPDSMVNLPTCPSPPGA